MSHTLAASRLSRWGVAMAASAVGMLTLAGAANATIYRPLDSASFRQAVLNANANPGFDKIILPGETSEPIAPTTNLNITDDLYITGDHAWQAPNFQGPSLSGAGVDNPQAPFITVQPGVRFIMSGATLTLASSREFAVIQNINGHVRLDNMSILSNSATVVKSDPPQTAATLVVTNSAIIENAVDAIESPGPITIINSTIKDQQRNGILANNNNLSIYNSLVHQPGPGLDCDLQGGIVAQSSNFDSDGSCGTATTVANPGVEFPFFYGGPTQTVPLTPGSPLIDAGDPAFCPASDQSFAVRPSGGCDVGASELGAAFDTTAPSCGVTATRRGPDEQDVTLSDTGSGIGYDGLFSEEVTITNGTVSHSLLPGSGSPATPARPGNAVITAVKANQAQRTTWGFIARDWAGNTRTCE